MAGYFSLHESTLMVFLEFLLDERMLKPNLQLAGGECLWASWGAWCGKLFAVVYFQTPVSLGQIRPECLMIAFY